VRTLQRYESQFGLPIHRPAGKDRSAVIAFSDELHQWLSRSPVKNHRHVRRVLLVLDLPRQESISNRKLVLEVGKFNVLTALSAEELYETAEKFEVDAYVIDCPPGDSLAAEICESLKERHPNQPLFAVVAETGTGSDAAKCADYVVNGNDAQKLLAAVTEVFGPPRIE
jgi:response regulator RpfG family c-di-GMP phosphodiesterase